MLENKTHENGVINEKFAFQLANTILNIKNDILELVDDSTCKRFLHIDKDLANKIENELNIDWDDFLQKENKKKYLNETPTPLPILEENKNISLSSFDLIHELGSGAFGKVYLAKKKDCSKYFAIKVLSKKFLQKKQKLRYAITETNILKHCKHPFIVNLHYTFQTSDYLYMVLDYCPGGDMLKHLIKKGSFSEEETRFFLPQIILAIEYLHNMNIIYRDLKPENVLLDQDGYIKLADFGLSKEEMFGNDLSMSFCGSPIYLPPEMLTKKGVGRAADIYQIGLMLYELLCGKPVFNSDSITKIYDKIKKGNFTIPFHISKDAKDLILKLMNINPTKRPGTLDKTEIKSHPFFKKIDFDLIYQKKYIPPDLEFENVIYDITNNYNQEINFDENNMEEDPVENFSYINPIYFNN